MGLINSNKEVSKNNVYQGEVFGVKLALAAEPDITLKPKDIVLVLDESGSMTGAPLTALKDGATRFIDMVYQATGAGAGRIIAGGSRIGIVSFNSVASIRSYLTTAVDSLKNAVSRLTASGSTNHQDAFIKAYDLFDDTSTNEKIIILFTDGDSNSGKDGFEEAKFARDNGVTIYSMGLIGNKTANIEALKNWATDPDAAFVYVVTSSQQVEDMFKHLAENITKPGATNICLTDVINPCFEVVSLKTPTKGDAVKVNNTTVKWTIDELGAGEKAEGAEFEFLVRSTGDCLGTMPVNKDYVYTDVEGNIVSLPHPQVTITKIPDAGVITEETIVPVNGIATSCQDTVELYAGDIELTSLGRIVNVGATIKNICPGKRVALGVILSELDAMGVEHARGMKTLLIPAHDDSGCKDIVVKDIKFVVPEALDATSTPHAICDERNFRARLIVNYVDTDYVIK